MKKDDFDERMEDYLDGSMTNEERTEFEQLLTSDPELRKLLDERKKFQELYVTTHRISELKSKISQAILAEKTNKGTNTDRLRKSGSYITSRLIPISFAKIAVAATIVALAVIGSLLLFDSGSREKENINIAELQKSTGSVDAYFPAGSTDSITGKAATEITGYANKDIVKGTGTFDEYFPDEFTKLTTSDTIRFTWPDPRPSRYLMLFDSKGHLVKKLKLKKKSTEYLLMPGILGEGIYYWKFMNDTALIRISVNKEP